MNVIRFRPYTLSLESHRHLRVSITDSIVGEPATILLTYLFVLDPFLCYIPYRQPTHLAEISMVERFQFGSVCFFQCPAFASPEYYCILTTIAWYSLRRISIGIFLLLSNCYCSLFMEPNNFLAWLIIRSVMSAGVSLSSGTK
jgi:hypothetical protein